MQNKICLDDDILYRKLDEIKIHHIDINKDSKRKVKLNIGNEEKTVYMINVEYKRVNKIYNTLLLVVPKQKLIELNFEKKYIKIEINDEIERKVKELEAHLKNLIYKNSKTLFNGKQFSIEKINSGLVSNIKILKNDRNKHRKYISIGIGKYTEFYEVEKTGKTKILKEKENIENIRNNIYCKTVISIDNLQFVDNIFTYNLILDLCEIEKCNNYSFVIKNGELKIADSEETDESDKLDDEYWDSASI